MNYLVLATIFLSEATEPVGVPGWVPVVIGVILLLLFWWGLNRNSIPQGARAQVEDDAPQMRNEPQDEHREDAATLAAAPTAVEPAATIGTAVDPDDLKKIEGIGPKIEEILYNSGIRTFAELAAASVTQLEKIVREDAGIRVAFPDTWPEQARLAASGEWAKLEQIQEDLKGGRRA